ncbi:MAG: antirestriction protein ArdA [Pseudomonadota bacterium]
MTTFFAQPYDIAASGFYFEDQEGFECRIGSIRNDYGQPVEEFEIQFIEGEAIDCALANAWGINQANIVRFLEVLDAWEDHEKLRFIIAVGECGYSFDPDTASADDYDVDIYDEESLRELAERFVQDGLFGDIPEPLRFYIDLDAIVRDLNADYTEIEIAGEQMVYRCG